MNALPNQAAMLQAIQARLQRGTPAPGRRIPEEGAYDGWQGPGALNVDGRGPGQTQTFQPGDSMSGRLNLGQGIVSRPLPYPAHPHFQPLPGHGMPGVGVPDMPMAPPNQAAGIPHLIQQLLQNTRSKQTSNIDALRARFAQMAMQGGLGRGR